MQEQGPPNVASAQRAERDGETDTSAGRMSRRQLVALSSIGGAALALGHSSAAVATLNPQFVSVRDFGAVGDGVTDDGLAIQQALTSAFGGHRISTVRRSA